MAKYTESKCRLCRREGAKLFLKGERCYKGVCAFEKRPVAPGQHTVWAERKFQNTAYNFVKSKNVREFTVYSKVNSESIMKKQTV